MNSILIGAVNNSCYFKNRILFCTVPNLKIFKLSNLILIILLFIFSLNVFAQRTDIPRSSELSEKTQVLIGNTQLETATPANVQPCLSTVQTWNGKAIRAGQEITFDLVDRKAAGGRAVFNPGDPDVKLPPEGGLSGRSRPPKVIKASLVYKTIALPTGADVMQEAWYGGPMKIVQITSFKNLGDGTVRINLPNTPGGTTETPGLLTIKTDVCTFTGQVEVGPKKHNGCWFPPAIMTLCNGRSSGKEFPTYGDDTGRSYFIKSKANFESDRVSTMTQYCAAYGAVHEGGTKTGNQQGTDEIIVWMGDTNSKVQVLSSCEVQVARGDEYALSYITQLSVKNKVSKLVSNRATRLTIAWKIKEPHGYCHYTVVVRGLHDESFPHRLMSLRSGSYDSSGTEYAFEHFSDKSNVLRRTRDDRGRYTVESYPLNIEDASQ